MLSALKNFTVAFALTAVIFGIIASIFCGYLLNAVTPAITPFDPSKSTDETTTPNGKDPDPSAPDEDEINGTSFNILVVATDYTPAKYEHYVLEKSDDYIKNIYEKYLKELEEEAERLAEEEKNKEENNPVEIPPKSDDEPDEIPEDPDEDPDGEEEEDEIEKSDPNINILKKDYPRITTDSILLIRFDKESKQVTITPIPSNTRLYINAANTTIGTLYTKYGIEFLTESVTAITGIGIDYYSVINITEIPKLIEMVGSVNVNVGQDIYFYNGDYLTQAAALEAENVINEKNEKIKKEENKIQVDPPVLALASGQQEITSENVTALLSFEGYTDGVTGETNTYLEFFKAFFAKSLSKEQQEKVEEAERNPDIFQSDEDEEEIILPTYTQTLDFISTNFAFDEYNKTTELIYSYSDFEILTMAYPGRVKVSDGIPYFAPDLTEGINMFKSLRGESNLRKLKNQSTYNSQSSANTSDVPSDTTSIADTPSNSGSSVFN